MTSEGRVLTPAKRPNRSVWWFLSREFHRDANTGHGTGWGVKGAKDCYECKRIVALIEQIEEARHG